MKKILNRLNSRCGETLLETLVATLIFTLGSIIMLSMITSAAKINNTAKKVDEKYYTDMRGIEALRLLEEGMEISQIAERMNYSSVNYLSSTFKKQFGLPPGQFRSNITKHSTFEIL